VSHIISLTMRVLIFMDIKCSYSIGMGTSKTTGVPKYGLNEKKPLIFKPVNFGHKIFICLFCVQETLNLYM